MNWSFDEKKMAWPATPDGEKVPPAYLVHLSAKDMESNIFINMLESYGIPTVTRYPGDGSFGRVILGISGTGVDIYVPETMLEDARALMEDFEDVQE